MSLVWFQIILPNYKIHDNETMFHGGLDVIEVNQGEICKAEGHKL